MRNGTKYPAHVIRALSVEAGCEPRTVVRHLAGERVQPMNAERIRKALANLDPAATDTKPKP